jgi:hypothetical protein
MDEVITVTAILYVALDNDLQIIPAELLEHDVMATVLSITPSGSSQKLTLNPKPWSHHPMLEAQGLPETGVSGLKYAILGAFYSDTSTRTNHIHTGRIKDTPTYVIFRTQLRRKMSVADSLGQAWI